MFLISKKDTNSHARSGTLTTPGGRIVETPAYAMVGTHAEVRCLPAEKMKDAKVQLIIANTYHLWQRLGKNIKTFPGLHTEMNTPDTVIITDSGGFQVFSLGFGREHGVGKVLGGDKKKASENLTRITEEGVFFTDANGEHFLGPKLSIEIQEKLGADIILAFDECTSPEHDYAYQREALGRTHRWAKECVDFHNRPKESFTYSREWMSGREQMLYGIVQGGVFEDLRRESSRYIGSLPFDGFAIGGSFGEDQMREVIRWSVSELPEEKPRHLLGIGRITDILDGVLEGVDTFDCVIPTREARHGSIWTHEGRVDIKKSPNRNSDAPLESGCTCPTCVMGITRGVLFDMFHSKDMKAGEYATMHNVFFFNTFMSEVRRAIRSGTIKEFSEEIRSKILK